MRQGGECPLQNPGQCSTAARDSRHRANVPSRPNINISAELTPCILCACCNSGSPTRSPAIQPIDMQSAAPCSRSRYHAFDGTASSRASPATWCRFARQARDGDRFTGSARVRSILVSSPSVCGASGCGSNGLTIAAARCVAAAAGDGPWKSTRRNATRGLHVRDPAGRDHHSPISRRWGTLRARWCPPRGRTHGGGRPGTGGSGRTGVLAGRMPRVRQVRAITLGTNDSTSAPGRTGRGSDSGARTPGRHMARCADLESARWCCWWDSSPKTSRRSCLRLRSAARRHRVSGVHDRPPPLVACTNAGPADQWRTRGADDLATGGDLPGHPGRHHGRGSAWPRYRRIVGGRRLADTARRPLTWVPGNAERWRSAAHAVTRWPPAGRRGRAQVCGVAYVGICLAAAGWDADGILAAAADETSAALLVGGIEPAGLSPDPDVLAALTPPVSQSACRYSAAERADVVRSRSRRRPRKPKCRQLRPTVH